MPSSEAGSNELHGICGPVDYNYLGLTGQAAAELVQVGVAGA
jgi:hypothetical protein